MGHEPDALCRSQLKAPEFLAAAHEWRRRSAKLTQKVSRAEGGIEPLRR